MAERKAALIAVIGKPGTGKTTFAIKTAQSIKAQKVLIVDRGFQEPKWDKYKTINGDNAEAVKKFTGWAKTDVKSRYSKGEPNLWDNVYYNMQNGVFILDDSRTYIPRNVPDEITQVMARRRQHGNDIIPIVHGFTQLPAGLYAYISHYALFATTDSLDSRKEYISHYYDKMVEIQKRVNEKAKTNPYYYEIIDVGKIQG